MVGAIERPIPRVDAGRECVTLAPRKLLVMETMQGRRRAIRHPALMPVDIDVAVGWTAAAFGHPTMGEEGARRFAQDAIDHTNIALRTTGIYHVTLHLVWSGQLNFLDTPGVTPQDAMDWLLADPTVQAMRESTNADEVWIITFWTTASAAPVPINPADFIPENGVAVVNLLGGVHSAAHEFGHTLGLFHDFAPIEKPPANDPFPYRYAYYSVAGNFKDIMTPRYKCPSCDVYDAFSNASPAMTFRGFATGGPKSDAATLIPWAAARVAGYSE